MSHLDRIAEIIGEALDNHFVDDAEQGAEVFEIMQDFKAKRHVSYHNLMRITGFKKLWDAIEVAAESAHRYVNRKNET